MFSSLYDAGNKKIHYRHKNEWPCGAERYQYSLSAVYSLALYYDPTIITKKAGLADKIKDLAIKTNGAVVEKPS
jgi:hypothetical protein